MDSKYVWIERIMICSAGLGVHILRKWKEYSTYYVLCTVVGPLSKWFYLISISYLGDHPYFYRLETEYQVFIVFKITYRTSLVEQCLRICLPMQGTRVQALVWEDPTCCGATKPMVRHNCWACTLEPVSLNYWARVLQLLKPTHLEPVLRNKRSHLNEKPVHHNEE